MPSLPSRKYNKDDADLQEKYKQAVAAGYAAALFDLDGYLFDARNWQDNVIGPKLKGDGWQRYVDDAHIGAVLMWVNGPDLVEPINFRMVTATKPPRLMYLSWTKQASDSLRLVIGATVPVVLSAH